MFGTNKSKCQSCKLYKFNIQKQKSGESIELKAISFPTICSPVNSEVHAENYKHLKDLELTDFDLNSNGDKIIDSLVGTDLYWEFVTGEVVQASNGPMAASSKLGWLISGPSPQSSTDECINNSRMQTNCDDELVNVLKTVLGN